jgi:anti-sigma factor RsiW
MTLDHRHVQDRLDHYLDGELPQEERLIVEEHLGRCDECLDEVEALRAIRDGARFLPREITPPRDLWPEIAARLRAAGELHDDSERPAIQVDFRAGRQPAVSRTWVIRIAAGLALVLASSSVTALLLRRPGTEPIATLPTNTALPPAMTALAAFEPTEAEYQGAVAELSAELRANRARLSPETIATVEENLRIIDSAIAESRAALTADPGDARIPLLLSGVYRKKVELLQHAVQLSART